MKNRMRIALGVVLAVFAFNIVQTVHPVEQAYAKNENAKKLQNEAKTHSVFWGIFRNCIQGGPDTSPGLHIGTKLEPQSGTGSELRRNQLIDIFDGSRTAYIGEHVEKDDGEIVCTNVEEMDKYLPYMGIKDTKELIDILYSPGSGTRDISSRAFEAIFKAYVESKAEKAEPGDGGIDNLSPGARWWLYYSALRNSACGFSTDMKDEDIAGSTNRHEKIWIVKDGKPVEVNGVLQDEEEANVGWGVYNAGADKTEDNVQVSCGDLLEELKNKSLAQAYADAEAEDLKNGGTSELEIAPSGIANQDVDPCEASGYTLSWILCAGIKILDDLVGWFGDQLVLLLRFDISANAATQTDSKDRGLYVSWASFRSIANVLLIIITLIIILSQIISIESLSAYTVKKALPRLVIAAIVVQLSWFVAAWLVGLIQALGDTTKDLILAPFAKSGVLQNVDIGGADSLLTFVGGGAAAIASGIGLWSSLGTVLIAVSFAVLAAFFVVLVRYLVIVACIVGAPIAFIAWILPNTQGVFKAWWNFFTKSLLMYPLIVMLLVSGRIASSLIMSGFASGGSIGNIWSNWNVAPWLAQTDGGGNTFIKLAAIAAYFAPYMMIPFTFKFAGGLISTVGGMVNDRSRGILDTRRKRTAEQNAARRAANATGNRFKDSNPFGRGFNRVSGGLGAGVGGRFGLGARGREVYASRRSAAQEERLRDPRWVASARRDDLIRAATYRNQRAAEVGMKDFYADKAFAESGVESRADWEASAAGQAALAKAERDGKVTARRAAGALGFNNREAAFKQMVMNGTAFTDARDVSETIARIAGDNFETQESLWGFNKAKQKEAYRNELSGVSMSDIDDARAHLRGPSAASDERLERNKHRAHVEGGKSVDALQAGRLKGNSVKNLAESSNAVLNLEGSDAVDAETVDNAKRVRSLLSTNLPQGNIGNQKVAQEGTAIAIEHDPAHASEQHPEPTPSDYSGVNPRYTAGEIAMIDEGANSSSPDDSAP